MSKKQKLVGEVTMYGTHEIGAGWLARSVEKPSEFHGDGEPKAGKNFTMALWQALAALQSAGTEDGLVNVFAAGGLMYAVVPLSYAGYFGGLNWMSAAAFTVEIPAEAILAAAS